MVRACLSVRVLYCAALVIACVCLFVCLFVCLCVCVPHSLLPLPACCLLADWLTDLLAGSQNPQNYSSALISSSTGKVTIYGSTNCNNSGSTLATLMLSTDGNTTCVADK